MALNASIVVCIVLLGTVAAVSICAWCDRASYRRNHSGLVTRMYRADDAIEHSADAAVGHSADDAPHTEHTAESVREWATDLCQAAQQGKISESVIRHDVKSDPAEVAAQHRKQVNAHARGKKILTARLRDNSRQADSSQMDAGARRDSLHSFVMQGAGRSKDPYLVPVVP